MKKISTTSIAVYAVCALSWATGMPWWARAVMTASAAVVLVVDISEARRKAVAR